MSSVSQSNHINDKKIEGKNLRNVHMGVLFGSLSIFASVLGASLTFPFLQGSSVLAFNCEICSAFDAKTFY